MSKCQRNKYLAGGRCGGSSGDGSGSGGATSAAFSAMLAAREAQTAALWKPAVALPQQSPFTQTTDIKSNTQIVLANPQKQINSKKNDIDMILNGDF